ncbi:hypothetical protein WI96_18255 [Burkholderia vietnamiensis]|nr:hypothetical protein WI96_18255 [Burkholderia vietnamiensis]
MHNKQLFIVGFFAIVIEIETSNQIFELLLKCSRMESDANSPFRVLAMQVCRFKCQYDRFS